MEVRIQKPTRMVYSLLIAIVLVGLLAPLLGSRRAAATTLAKAYVRLDKLTALTATTGRVCATPSSAGAGTEGKVIVTFPTTAATSYAVSGTTGNWTVNTTFETGSTATAWPGIGTATSVTGNAVTFPSGDLSSGAALYCFNWTNTAALTTSSAGVAVTGGNFGSVETQTAAAAQIDKSFWGVDIISAGTDIVTVTATVAPFFTMALNGNVDGFAAFLSSASVNTSNGGRTIQVDTNALNGWILWVKGTNSKSVSDTGTTGNLHGALTSATAGASGVISNNTVNALATPNASHTFTAGTEDYGLATTLNTNGAGGGTPTMNSVYDGTTSNQAGVIDPTQYRPIASSAGYAVGDKINIIILVTITNNIPPGADYTDILRYIGAGQF